MSTRITLTAEAIDLIDDALAYYRLSGMGGGDRDNPDDIATMTSLQDRLERARERLAGEWHITETNP